MSVTGQNTLTNIAAEMAAVALALRQSAVQVFSRRSGGGSGVIWHPDGLIVTNAHVATSERATVELSDGRVFAAVRTGFHPERDLAALKIEATGLSAATIGDSDTLRVGELVLAVGNPRGIAGALTAGIIHAIEPAAELEEGPTVPAFKTWWQSPNPKSQEWVIADVRLAPGNSGGILANARGEVIGINTMIAGGLALAVPSKAVQRFLRDMARPQLGVTLRPVLAELGGERPKKRQVLGLLVLDVAFNSLAMAAGLKTGDVLVGICGQHFHTPDDLLSVLWHAEPGELLPVEFLRGGKRCRSAAVVAGTSDMAGKVFAKVMSP